MASINYDDERFTEVEEQKQQALTENEKLYGGMIDKSNQFYQQQIDATEKWGETQQQLQQEQTDFAIEQINQQKEQQEKDYKKEQAGAYADWKKESNQYGAEAEQMAAQGLANTGFSESSKVSMWNTYQNRMASARESFKKATLEFDNAIKEAQLQNNSKLAELAYTTYMQKLQLALEGFQNNNQLLLEQANRKQEIDNTYYGRYQDVVNQINQEKAFAEEQRQYNESLALQKAQFAEDKRQFNASYALQKQQVEQQAKINKTQQIKTQYYSGNIAEDVGGYGYMGKDENGVAYQPKGVYVIHNGQRIPMKLQKTGQTAQQMFGQGSTNSSGVNVDKQNVWKAGGFYFIWNGTKNQYDCVGRIE